MGVFATRSPFRPNPVGLSCVKLLGIEKSEKYGCFLRVSGADMLDGTPIFDIKPYLPYADSHPEARGGFAQAVERRELAVDFPTELLEQVAEDRREGLMELLKQDPRPAYQKDPQRVYGFPFGGLEIKFSVDDESMRLTVRSIERIATIIQ